MHTAYNMLNKFHTCSNFSQMSSKALKIASVCPVMVTILSGHDPSDMLIFAWLCNEYNMKTGETISTIYATNTYHNWVNNNFQEICPQTCVWVLLVVQPWVPQKRDPRWRNAKPFLILPAYLYLVVFQGWIYWAMLGDMLRCIPEPAQVGLST